MAREQNSPKRWRPRWSVRILLIVITLICAYFACWGPTKRQGVEYVRHQVYKFKFDIEAVAPLLVKADDFYRRSYYFWFFGYVAKLPYERELPDDPTPPKYRTYPTDPH